ncbi:TadE/TadG family type IV pilus assembly protein [Zavarzinia sp. CC-PAN008]|uniref:TadE/TadG family type IV pilus assembly protein n=1 Tax=Zavarzinia sp. CC-PAN008 TaxID=3243332 RepID=UPI003F748C72
MRRLVSSFAREERGAVIVEFALVLPILAALLCGVYEISTYILLNNKLHRAAQSVASLVALQQTMQAGTATGGVDTVANGRNGLALPFGAAEAILRPFGLPANGNTVISLVARRVANQPVRVVWQRIANANPSVGKMPNENAVVTGFDTLLTNAGSFTVVVDTFYTYDPIFSLKYFTPFTGPTVALHERAVYQPRFARLPAADAYNF